MKKILLLIIFMLSLLMPNVYADDYDIREVVPKNIQTSISGEKLFYKNITYDNGVISMEYIRNNSYEDLYATVTMIVFDKDKLSIGVINYCDKDKPIPGKTNYKDIKINVADYKMASGSSVKDIEYYAVLNENITCKQNDYSDYYGKKIEDIGSINHYDVNANTDAGYLVYMLVGVGVVILFLFLYKFLFTSSYQNMDGEDYRKAFKQVNEENLMVKEAKDRDVQAAVKKQKEEEDKKKKEEHDQIYKNNNNDGNELEDMYK